MLNGYEVPIIKTDGTLWLVDAAAPQYSLRVPLPFEVERFFYSFDSGLYVEGKGVGLHCITRENDTFVVTPLSFVKIEQ